MNDQEFNVDEAQIGRVLHFVVPSGRCRPALVLEDWPSQGKPGYVNLVVFPDGSNDGKYGVDDHTHPYSYESGEIRIGGPSNIREVRTGSANLNLLVRWETSVLPNHAVRAMRSWHWPRECRLLQDPAPPFVHPLSKEVMHHNHATGIVDPHNCYACHIEEMPNVRR